MKMTANITIEELTEELFSGNSSVTGGEPIIVARPNDPYISGSIEKNFKLQKCDFIRLGRFSYSLHELKLELRRGKVFRTIAIDNAGLLLEDQAAFALGHILNSLSSLRMIFIIDVDSLKQLDGLTKEKGSPLKLFFSIVKKRYQIKA